MANGLEGQALRDEIQFHIAAGQCALAMDDFEAAAMHCEMADRLMHNGLSTQERLPELDRLYVDDAGDDPCQICPATGCDGSHCKFYVP